MTIKKYPIFIRIAKNSRAQEGFKVAVSKKKDNRALLRTEYDKVALPTLQFKLNVFIDDKEFDDVKKTLDLSLENLEPSLEIEEEKQKPHEEKK